MGSSWEEIYRMRSTTAAEAVRAIRSGMRVFVGSGCGRPTLLVEEMMKLAARVRDVEILHAMVFGPTPYTDPGLGESFRHNALDVGENTRGAIETCRADYTPAAGYRIPTLLANGRIPVDVALLLLSPPDKDGFCSLGISVDLALSASEHAGRVLAEVSPLMPRTRGVGRIPVERIDAFVHSDRPPQEAPRPEIDEVARRIAEHCAKLIECGDTLRMGYDPIACALAERLIQIDRHDLGIHTESFTEAMMDLMLAGVATNARKNVHEGRSIASCCIGTRRLYEFVHDNPEVELYGAGEVSDPRVIAANERMAAVCQVDQVDLTGQAADEPAGASFRGGFDGRVDFLRGAAASRDGKPILVLPSTTPDASRSNIKVFLDAGASVVANRADGDYVVTEWGSAALQGRSTRERAIALIGIAHPKFRTGLMTEARRKGYVHGDQLMPPPDSTRYPDEMEEGVLLHDELRVFFRPVRPTDERIVQSFLYSLSERSVYHRFHGELRLIDHSYVQQFVNIDHADNMAILGLLGSSAESPRMIAMGQYLRYPGTDRAEVAFVTHDQYQNRGIATWILRSLVTYARHLEMKRFVAEVLHGNVPMMRVFEKSGLRMRCTSQDGVHLVELDL